MHTIIATRGQKDKVEKFINDLLSVQCFYEKKDDKGKTTKHMLQVGAQPFQLWSITYPKESHDGIMKLIHPTVAWHKSLNKFVKIARLLMGLKPIPPFKHDLRQAIPYRALNMVEVIGIGTKSDVEIDGIEQI